MLQPLGLSRLAQAALAVRAASSSLVGNVGTNEEGLSTGSRSGSPYTTLQLPDTTAWRSAATNFSHYVERTYLTVVMPLFAKSTRDRSEGILEHYLLPTFGELALRDLTPYQSKDTLQYGDVRLSPRIAGQDT
jgi:hypothetical protein